MVETRSMASVPLRAVEATRYVTPLREGGSLPGLVEASDDGLYVAKFRGAGQGVRALVAEIIVGELIRAARSGDPGAAGGLDRLQPRRRLPARLAALRR
jgi:hypothetical protein